MGQITHLLAKKRIESTSDLLPSRLITEDNRYEGVHVHLRNLRVEFTEAEYAEFVQHTIRGYKALKSGDGVNRDDGRDNFATPYYVLDEVELAGAPDLFPHKFQIELNLPRVVHVHMRNLRVELTPREFLSSWSKGDHRVFQTCVSFFKMESKRVST